jgi:hypothetical protein
LLYPLLGLLAFGAALTPAADGDIWWHLSAGREMVRTHAVPAVDTLSVSAAGRPWTDLHWLFQLLAYGVFRAGGLGLLVAAKALAVGVGAALLLAAVERGAQARAGVPPAPGAMDAAPSAARLAGPLLVPVLALALLAVRPLLLLRPVVLTLLFLSVYTWILERFRTGGRARALWWLPCLQVVWVNCQGLSPLGPALIACHLAGGWLGARLGRPELPAGAGRRLLPILGACLLAGLVTPYGLRGFLLPLALLGRVTPTAGNVFSGNVAENVPPWILGRSAPGEVWHLSWFLLLLAASFVAGRRALVLGRCLVALVFAALALLANRNVLLFYWLASPVVAWNLTPPLAAAIERLRARAPALRRLPAGLHGAVVAAVAVLTVAAARGEPSIAEPAPFRVPAGAARFIAARGGAGAIFCADHYGGYLAWTLAPRFRPYMDTRLILRTAAEYQEYLGVLDHPERFDELQARQRFAYAILPTAFPDRYLPLVQHLGRSPAWRLVHTDGTEVLFASADQAGDVAALDLGARAVTDRLLASLSDRHRSSPDVLRAARLQLARLQLALGHVDEGRHVAAALGEEDADAQALLARADLLAGDLASCELRARKLVAADPTAVGPLDLLALVAFQRGDSQAGVAWLRRALAIDPYDAEARAILDEVERGQSAPGASPTPPAP